MVDGNVVELTDVEKDLLTVALKKLHDLRTTLGVVREDFLSREQKVMESLDEEKKTFISRITSMAESKGISVSDDKNTWNFDLNTLTFVKGEQA